VYEVSVQRAPAGAECSIKKVYYTSGLGHRFGVSECKIICSRPPHGIIAFVYILRNRLRSVQLSNMKPKSLLKSPELCEEKYATFRLRNLKVYVERAQRNSNLLL
jgi:hypothetical protein